MTPQPANVRANGQDVESQTNRGEEMELAQRHRWRDWIRNALYGVVAGLATLVSIHVAPGGLKQFVVIVGAVIVWFVLDRLVVVPSLNHLFHLPEHERPPWREFWR